MQASGFLRKMSFTEHLYQVGESIIPPFALQYVIKGKGHLDAEQIRISLLHLAKVLPSLHLQLKGKQWFADGNPPDLVAHPVPFSNNWDEKLFRSRLHASKGQCAELHLFPGPSPVLVFRILHSVMDAKGVQQLLKDLFACMRGETIAPYPEFPADRVRRDERIATEQHGQYHQAHSFRSPGFPLFEHEPTHYQTAVLPIDTKLEAPLAKVGSWYAKQLGQACRVMIPVDLRRHAGIPSTCSNLTLPIYLPVTPEQSWQEIQASLLTALAAQEELSRERFEEVGRFLPSFLLRRAMNTGIKFATRKQQFPISGILSDNGFLELSAFSTEIFQAEQVISLPVYVPLAPFCMAVTHHERQSNLAFSIPKGMDLDSIRSSLQTSLYADSEFSASELAAHEIPEHDLRILQSLWAEVLECPAESIGPDVLFFTLGGDSLKLLRLLSEVSDEYPMKSQSAFFQAVLNRGGQLSIRSLIEIMEDHRL